MRQKENQSILDSNGQLAQLTISRKWPIRFCRFLWTIIALIGILEVVCLIKWRQDLNAIEQCVNKYVTASELPSETMRQVLHFIRKQVPEGNSTRYFLIPLFRFMRPTALQVIEDGGDCAYRARALIVILSRFDIKATKMALYNSKGDPVHAVVKVDTERGPYIIDVLFNIIHQWKDGSPIPLDRLQHDKILAESVEMNNPKDLKWKYPIREYMYKDVRTINWQKNRVSRAIYRTLESLIGKSHADNIPRTMLAEEPALMVIAVCTIFQFVILLAIMYLRKTSRKCSIPDERTLVSNYHNSW